jgi:hypothetical protein
MYARSQPHPVRAYLHVQIGLVVLQKAMRIDTGLASSLHVNAAASATRLHK